MDMAEYTNNAVQTVAVGANVLFTEQPFGCSRGYIMHRDGSGLVTLRAPSGCPARFRVTFSGNLAVPDGVAPAPVSVAVAIDGEALYSAISTTTPAAALEYNAAYSTALVCVPAGCCVSVSVENAGTTAANVANPNLIVERVA